MSTRLPFYFIPAVLLLLIACKSSQQAQSIESIERANSAPEVIVETKAAIIGGFKALQKQLEYPPKAKKDGVETVLEANVLINKKGEVEDISFGNESPTDYGFEDAAQDALRTVKFKAGERNGDPVSMYITIPVRFEL